MSSTSRRQFLSNRLPGARTRLYAVLALVLVAAVFGAGAVTASNDRSSLTGQLFSYLGFNAGSQTERGDMSGVLPQPRDTPPAEEGPWGVPLSEIRIANPDGAQDVKHLGEQTDKQTP